MPVWGGGPTEQEEGHQPAPRQPPPPTHRGTVSARAYYSISLAVTILPFERPPSQRNGGRRRARVTRSRSRQCPGPAQWKCGQRVPFGGNTRKSRLSKRNRGRKRVHGRTKKLRGSGNVGSSCVGSLGAGRCVHLPGLSCLQPAARELSVDSTVCTCTTAPNKSRFKVEMPPC